MFRLIAVVNVMVARSHNEPFESVGAPHNVGMHPIVLEIVEETNREFHPGRREIQKRVREQIGKIHRDILRDRATEAGEPIHMRG